MTSVAVEVVGQARAVDPDVQVREAVGRRRREHLAGARAQSDGASGWPRCPR